MKLIDVSYLDSIGRKISIETFRSILTINETTNNYLSVV